MTKNELIMAVFQCIKDNPDKFEMLSYDGYIGDQERRLTISFKKMGFKIYFGINGKSYTYTINTIDDIYPEIYKIYTEYIDNYKNNGVLDCYNYLKENL